MGCLSGPHLKRAGQVRGRPGGRARGNNHGRANGGSASRCSTARNPRRRQRCTVRGIEIAFAQNRQTLEVAARRCLAMKQVHRAAGRRGDPPSCLGGDPPPHDVIASRSRGASGGSTGSVRGESLRRRPRVRVDDIAAAENRPDRRARGARAHRGAPPTRTRCVHAEDSATAPAADRWPSRVLAGLAARVLRQHQPAAREAAAHRSHPSSTRSRTAARPRVSQDVRWCPAPIDRFREGCRRRAMRRTGTRPEAAVSRGSAIALCARGWCPFASGQREWPSTRGSGTAPRRTQARR